MCNPAVVALIPTMIQGGQAAMGGQSDMSTLQSNIDVAKKQKAATLSAGARSEAEKRQEGEAIKGSQIASMGASGAVAGSGSFGKVLENTAGKSELDALTIRSNALREAWGYDVQIANMESQLAEAETKQTLLTGGLGTQKGRKFLGAASLTGGASAPFMTSSKAPLSSKGSIL